MKTRQAIQKPKPASSSTFEDDTRTTAQAIIALARARDDAEAPVRRLLRAYAARARAISGAKEESHSSSAARQRRAKHQGRCNQAYLRPM